MQKAEVIKTFGLNPSDTGSPEVQIALLTSRINEISEHLKIHKKDFAAKRGLLILISQRNSFLRYLVKKDRTRYISICERLSIRTKF